MANPWVEAYRQAMGQHQQTLHQLVGQESGTVGDDVQRARYQHLRANPRALVEWAETMNGREQALPAAQEYLKEMGRKYGV